MRRSGPLDELPALIDIEQIGATPCHAFHAERCVATRNRFHEKAAP